MTPVQLLDEIVDFGYPQNTSPEMLKTYNFRHYLDLKRAVTHPIRLSYILQEQLDIAKLLGVSGVKQQTTSVAPAVTGAVSWRREGLKYKKNEARSSPALQPIVIHQLFSVNLSQVFLDVVENVNALVSNKVAYLPPICIFILQTCACLLSVCFARVHLRQGAILRSDVAGEVQMKCLLSGMPGTSATANNNI
jgi:hypothetical protein